MALDKTSKSSVIVQSEHSDCSLRVCETETIWDFLLVIARRGNSGKAAGGGIEGAPKQKQMTKAVQERFGVAAKASTIHWKTTEWIAEPEKDRW